MFLDEELLSVAGTSRPGVRGGIPSKFEWATAAVDNRLSILNVPSLAITGDLDISALVDLGSTWPAAARKTIVNKWQGGATDRAYFLDVVNGRLELQVSLNGSVALPYNSNALSTVGIATGAWWIRAIRVASTGVVSFFFAPFQLDYPINWTSIPLEVGTPTIGTIFSENSPIWIGQFVTAGREWAGRLFRLVIKNGINGIPVLDISPGSIVDPSLTTFKCATGQTVTETGDVIKPIPRGKMEFVGVNTNFLEVPDHPSLDNSGRFEIVSKINCPDYTSGTTQMIVGKDLISTGSRSWIIRISISGQINFVASTNGSVQDIVVASVGAVFVDGSAFWIRMLRELNGDISFYQANDSAAEPTSWTFLNTVSSVAGPLVNSVHPVRIGNRLGTNIEPFIGRIHRIILRNNEITTLDVNDNDIYDPDVKTFTAFPGLPVTETGDVIKAV